MSNNLFDVIWYWKVFWLRNGNEAVYVSKKVDAVLRYELCIKGSNGLSHIEHYDENGYCFGDGVDFGNIPDSSSKYLIVGKPNDDF